MTNLYYPCNQITGEHVFVYSGHNTNDLPDKSLRCACGAFSFGESRPTLYAVDGAYALGMPVEIANWLAPEQWFLHPPHRR